MRDPAKRSDALMQADVKYTDNLYALMMLKVEVLEQLCELAKLQTTICQTSDASILLGFLSRKQPLMDQLAECKSIYRSIPTMIRKQRFGARASSDKYVVMRLCAVRICWPRSYCSKNNRLTKCRASRGASPAQLQDDQDGSIAAQAYHSSNTLSEGSLDLTSAG